MADTTLLKNGNLITMKDEKLLEGWDLLVEEGTIRGIERDISPEGKMTIDCTGKYLIPGLFDMHAHTIFSHMNEAFLVNGVTSVRNMWGFPRILEWTAEIDRNERTGPSIYSTGPLLDGKEFWPGCVVVSTPEEAEKAVKETVEAGYHQVKTYPDIPRDAFIRLMETAGKLGIRVVGHGNKNVSTRELIDLGYYSVEHASILPKNEEEVFMLVEAGVWNCPTLVVIQSIDDYLLEGKPFSDAPYYSKLNQKTRDYWEDERSFLVKNPRMKELRIDTIFDMGRIFAQHSEKLLAGSDSMTMGVAAGFSLLDELELMVSVLEVSPFKALRGATAAAAEHLDIEKKTGTLEAGKDADILVLDANPLEEISNVRKLDVLIQHGRVYDRPALDRMLERVRTIPAEDVEAIYTGV